MARKNATVFITEEGRDKGKRFLLTEKPAMQAEKWAIRALQAAIRSGVQIPDDIAKQGMAAVAAVGIQALVSMNFAEAEPLMDELMDCIMIVRDPKHPEGTAFPIIPNSDDIEEIQTIVKLQREVISLHINFSTIVSPSTSTSEARPSNSTSIKTSLRQSVRPSPRAPTRVPR